MNIYVGNLAYETTENDLKQAFEVYGKVDTARTIVDKYTNQSKGFGFVEMPDKAEAQAAISGMDGKDMGGRSIKVNEARPKTEGGRGGGGYGGGGGGRSW